MANKRQSTEKILDFLETSVPEIPKSRRSKRKARASVDEDLIPTPAIDKELAQGSGKRLPENDNQLDDRLTPVVIPTEMGAKPKTRELVDRLLRTGMSKGPKLL